MWTSTTDSIFPNLMPHYGIKPVTSWYNITSRNAIESNLWNFIYRNIQRTKYVFLKLFRNFWNVPVPVPEPSQLALSWLQLFMSTLPARWASASLTTVSNVPSSVIRVYMSFCNILWSLVRWWKINLLLHIYDWWQKATCTVKLNANWSKIKINSQNMSSSVWFYSVSNMDPLHPDSKIHGANMGPSGADRTQVGPILAP